MFLLWQPQKHAAGHQWWPQSAVWVSWKGGGWPGGLVASPNHLCDYFAIYHSILFQRSVSRSEKPKSRLQFNFWQTIFRFFAPSCPPSAPPPQRSLHFLRLSQLQLNSFIYSSRSLRPAGRTSSRFDEHSGACQISAQPVALASNNYSGPDVGAPEDDPAGTRSLYPNFRSQVPRFREFPIPARSFQHFSLFHNTFPHFYH